MTLNAQFFSSSLEQADKDLFNSISQELSRQQNQIELIASENIVSKAVLEAQGSIMTNKYAEGYSAKSCLLYTSPSPRDATLSRMPSSA